MEFSTFLTTLTLPDAPPSGDPASLFALLAQLPDPRKQRGRRSALAVVLTRMILAKLAGETTPRGIAQWARLRTEWLCAVLPLRRRLPCANPSTLIAAKVDVADLNQGYGRIEVRQLHASIELNAYLAGQWHAVAQVFQIEREIVRQEQAAHAVVYGLTSIPAEVSTPEEVLDLVRRHWHLEHRVH